MGLHQTIAFNSTSIALKGVVINNESQDANSSLALLEESKEINPMTFPIFNQEHESAMTHLGRPSVVKTERQRAPPRTTEMNGRKANQ